ncbi:hypothetical protein SSX86_003990 [Deinandra increscens subsp. villosa]|uniref:AMP-dependent synthetase/ligase domain-containing protein n=1 Tax=Deinandra increscens subsp. villosa TaxID=3103831 RepID=A0AAP0DIQ5_9ASTR
MVSPENTNWIYEYGLIEDIPVPDANFSAPASRFSLQFQPTFNGSSSNPSADVDGSIVDSDIHNDSRSNKRFIVFHVKWGPYLWKTYKTVYDEVLNAASALRAAGIEPGCKVGIYGANCPQWIVPMEACNAESYISVPLYDTLGPGLVNFILDHAEVDVVFVQNKKVLRSKHFMSFI